MVIDKFAFLMEGAAMFIKHSHESGNISSIEQGIYYQKFRQNLIDLIIELSQGANVDFDELNATMRDWR